MEIETDYIISEEHKEEANKFGIQSSEFTEAKKYITAFLNRLLLLRDKVDKDLFTTQLNPVITKLWQEMLSSLEESNRKLINIQSGSLIFKLFCPTKNSVLQIQDDKSKIELQEKNEEIAKGIRYVLNLYIFLTCESKDCQ